VNAKVPVHAMAIACVRWRNEGGLNGALSPADGAHHAGKEAQRRPRQDLARARM